MSILFSPRRFFDEIERSAQLAPLLIILRWGATASFVILPLWLFRVPIVTAPLLPIIPQHYYFWELLFMLPYGVVLTFIISLVSLASLRLCGRRGPTLRIVFAVVSYSLFLPWIPCLIWDLVLVFTWHWTLAWLLPFHTAAVVAETGLYSWGFHKVFGTPWWKAIITGILNSLVFIGLSAIIVR